MTIQLLFVLLGIAIILLGVASEFAPPLDRVTRVVAAVLGVVVLVAVLVR